MSKNKPVRNFGVVLSQLEDGDLMQACSDEFARLNEKLAELAAFANREVKGEIALKLRVKHSERGVVEIEGEIVTKTPKIKRSQSVLWVTQGGELVMQNPRQRTIEEHIREVPAPQPEVREASEIRTQKEA